MLRYSYYKSIYGIINKSVENIINTDYKASFEQQMEAALLYDSLFADMEYAAVEFSIEIPTGVAKEAGILEIDVKGKDTSIDLGKFFDKEDAFIEQWLEISYLQAEPY